MPHGLRKEMYEEVLRLYSQGLGYTRIIRKLRARFGVTVSKSNIFYWVRGVRTPYYVRRPQLREWRPTAPPLRCVPKDLVAR